MPGIDRHTRDLRRRAEERFARAGSPASTDVVIADDRMQHELHICQLELEMQREEIEAARDRFASLYDFAPVGIMTLDARTRILDGNITARAMLGVDLPFDGRVAFARFLDEGAADRLQLLLRRADERAALEVVIHPTREPAFEAMVVLSPADEPIGAMRAALVDLRGAEPRARPSAPRAGLTVLLVDDEPMLRRAVARVLGDLGADVRSADDGEHAIAIAAAEHVDVLLVDVRMPRVDGPTVARRVRAARPRTVVVYMSGEPKPVHVAARRLDEVDRVLEKPFSPAALVDELRGAIAAQAVPARRRVLVVDPYEGGRRALCALLADMDYDLVDAASAADAVAVIGLAPVDLVIADHGPPWARADEVIAALRAKQPDLAALVLVGGKAEAPPALERCRTLRKPISVGELAGALDELLELRVGR